MSAREYLAWLDECRNAPAGTWSCLNPGHQKYVGERWVPVAGFNKGDIWCRRCRSSYMKARWQRVGPIINAMQRERYLLDESYREQECARSRSHYQRNATTINQARRERYHDKSDSTYRDQALARARRQAARRRAGTAAVGI